MTPGAFTVQYINRNGMNSQI